MVDQQAAQIDIVGLDLHLVGGVHLRGQQQLPEDLMLDQFRLHIPHRQLRGLLGQRAEVVAIQQAHALVGG